MWSFSRANEPVTGPRAAAWQAVQLALDEGKPKSALEALAGVDDGYHLTTDLIDRSIEYLEDLPNVDVDKPWMLYLATGALSTISDNVFVATIYISEIKAALLQGQVSREQFDMLAVAINTGTNIPSVATPNGQAAFLFMLTSTLAPLIRLGYGRMLWMTIPYFVTMTIVGLAAVWYLL